MPRNYDKHTDIQTDTRSRSRQYIGRAKDWVEWTLEEPKRVKNSVLPRWRSAANMQLMILTFLYSKKVELMIRDHQVAVYIV